MKKPDPKIVVGVLLFAGLVSSTAYTVRHRKREQLASKLYQALSRELRPSGAGLEKEAAFDLDYIDKIQKKAKGSLVILKNSTVSRYVKMIHKAWKPWYLLGDDEDKVYGVFRSLKDKVQVAQLAKTYQETYQKNLVEVLRNRLDDTEIRKVLAIVRKLPDYRTA